VLLALIGYVLGRGDAGPGLAPDAVRAHLRDRLKKLHRSVARDGRRFQRLDEAAQHRVRKRLKRLRYLAELASALYPAADVERYLRRLRSAQDALGLHNDTWVAQRAYEQAARAGTAEAWFAAGWLKAHQQTTGRACRKALRRVGAAPVFW
jgi:CHAD domain-containing protein